MYNILKHVYSKSKFNNTLYLLYYLFLYAILKIQQKTNLYILKWHLWTPETHITPSLVKNRGS